MTKPKPCTVKNCIENKTKGDALFCFTHRNNWEEYCSTKGIIEKEINSLIEKTHLKHFQENEII